jgi:hypothetical protein
MHFSARSRLTSPPRNVFRNIIGFGQAHFMPHVATTFLQKLAVKHFIEGFSFNRILLPLLQEESSLGAHSAVFHLSDTFCREWAWYHSQARPQGIPLSQQCPSCRCLQTLKTNYQPHATLVVCEACRHTVITIPREKYLYTCDEGMSKGSGWGMREHWVA